MSGQTRCFIGVDVGTSSTKGVLVSEDGAIVARAQRPHRTSNPLHGWFEQDAECLWWAEFAEVTGELLHGWRGDLAGVGVSGIGPCLLPTDASGQPLRPAILYGVDTRAARQVDELTAELGERSIVAVGGSELSSQAVGPKMVWLRENEPEVWHRTRRFFMASSFLVHRLTGAYILDHHSASQCDPLYDIERQRWHEPWTALLAPRIEMPELVWPGDVVGRVSTEAAAQCAIPAGTPVIAGTIDAWAEALSVGVRDPGATMLMYGTALFIVQVTERPVRAPGLWATSGVLPGTWGLASGLASGGGLTAWVRDLTSTSFETLFAEAAALTRGSDGLLTLPYFAGERRPDHDPDARGIFCGLTLAHTRGHLFLSALEATGFAARHMFEAYARAGTPIERVVAVGGGTTTDTWLQVMSDVTGVEQDVPEVTVGASYGDAMLAACAAGTAADPFAWPRIHHVVSPDPRIKPLYDEQYAMFHELYDATRPLVHRIAATRPRD